MIVNVILITAGCILAWRVYIILQKRHQTRSCLIDISKIAVFAYWNKAEWIDWLNELAAIFKDDITTQNNTFQDLSTLQELLKNTNSNITVKDSSRIDVHMDLNTTNARMARAASIIVGGVLSRPQSDGGIRRVANEIIPQIQMILDLQWREI